MPAPVRGGQERGSGGSTPEMGRAGAEGARTTRPDSPPGKKIWPRREGNHPGGAKQGTPRQRRATPSARAAAATAAVTAGATRSSNGEGMT